KLTKKKTIDVTYNFLDDVGNGEFDSFKFTNSNYINGMKVNGYSYKDPDAYSKKLYEYFKILYEKKLPTGEKLIFEDIKPNYYKNYELLIKSPMLKNSIR